MRLLVVGALTVTALRLVPAACAAGPHIVTETVADGTTHAQLTYLDRGSSVEFFRRFADFTLTVKRDGKTLLHTKLGAPDDMPANALVAHAKSVAVARLDRDAAPDVDVTFYTGGAHCCFLSVLYLSGGHASSYTRRVKWWGDPLPSLVDLNKSGVTELKSVDDRFAYAFTDYADSAMPVQVWSYADGRANDITRQFPSLVRQDAARQWQAYLSRRSRRLGSVRGILAAYLADESMLGAQDAAWTRVLAARPYLVHGYDLPKKATAYFALVRNDLKTWGY